MSAASLGDGNKLFKGAIRQYFVKSLLQDLGKLHTLTTNIGMQVRIQNKSTEIQKEVEQMTGFLVAIDEWENRVFDSFSKIKQRISRKMGDDSMRKMVENILAEIKELKKLAPNIDTFKLVESNSVKDTSSTENDGSSEYVKCIEKLNAQQKECLRSLAIFPENTELKKRLLINWWIGLGLLPCEGNTSATENQSVDIFNKLEETNILKPKRVKEHNKVVDSYTINPTIHKQIIESEETKGLHRYKNEDEVVAILNLNKMHLSNYINIEPTIKVVQLGEWRHIDFVVHNMNKETIHGVAGTKFLEKMGEAVTYLSIRGISKIEKLPQSIGKMRDLKILDLKDCHSLQELPQKPKPKIRVGVRSNDSWFKELTHLDITGCYLLHHMPKWVCELSNLQVLKGAVFNGFIPEGEEQSQLKDISKLRKLIKLSIKIIYPHFLPPIDCTGLKDLNSLLVLTIAWGGCGTSEQITSANVDQDVVTERQSRENSRGKMLGGVIKRDEKMKEKKQRKQSHGENEDGMKTPIIYFPENLEKLDIRCYPNAEAPELSNAAKLKKLKRLYIRGGKLAKFGDDVDWRVEILRLRFLKYLKIDWFDLNEMFTNLEVVEFKKCPNLTTFPRTRRGVCYPKKKEPIPIDDDGDDDDDDALSRRVELKIISNLEAPLDKCRHTLMLELTGNVCGDRPRLALVAVLDVCAKLNEDNKLEKMKAAIRFVINKLTSVDYFSIVIFSKEATTLWPLQKMTETCKKELEYVVSNLQADDTKVGKSYEGQGLQMGLNILKDPKINNGSMVKSMILVSSGSSDFRYVADAVVVHTFGFGKDHSPRELNWIADRSIGGTYSSVRNTNNLTKAIAVCLAGLLTVVVQDLVLTVAPIEESSTMMDVEGAANSTWHKHYSGPVDVSYGNLYSREIRKMLVTLSLPDVDEEGSTNILKASYSYKVSGKVFQSDPVIITANRMKMMPSEKLQAPPEVIAESARIHILWAIRYIARYAEFNVDRYRSEYDDLKNSEDELCKLLCKDLEELVLLISKSQHAYAQSLACSLNTCHRIQRAAARGDDIEESIRSFGTPSMFKFLKDIENGEHLE